jgi:TetR/AcrR family transcriptional repressor of nem operon
MSSMPIDSVESDTTEGGPTKGPTTRDRLLWSATNLIREHGLHATTVDEVCEQAGVSKGAFFHHFSSKEDMALEAALSWTEHNEVFFGAATYHAFSDPLDRVIGYLDFRESLIVGEPKDFTCLVGTVVQEAYESHPLIREACRSSIVGHAQSLEPDLELAISHYRPDAGLDASMLALHTRWSFRAPSSWPRPRLTEPLLLTQSPNSARTSSCCLAEHCSANDARHTRGDIGARRNQRVSV